MPFGGCSSWSVGRSGEGAWIPRFTCVQAKIIALAVTLGISLGPATAHAAPEPTAPAIDEYLTNALESTGAPGFAVVVTNDDRVVHAAGHGHDSGGQPRRHAWAFRIQVPPMPKSTPPSVPWVSTAENCWTSTCSSRVPSGGACSV